MPNNTIAELQAQPRDALISVYLRSGHSFLRVRIFRTERAGLVLHEMEGRVALRGGGTQDTSTYHFVDWGEIAAWSQHHTNGSRP